MHFNSCICICECGKIVYYMPQIASGNCIVYTYVILRLLLYSLECSLEQWRLNDRWVIVAVVVIIQPL